MISDSDAERLARHWGESLRQPFYFFSRLILLRRIFRQAISLAA